MSITIADMKNFLNAQYPNSINWHRKVRQMHPAQTIAIYYSMKDRAAKKKLKAAEKLKAQEKKEQEYHQIDMWEYLSSITNNHTQIEIKG